MGESIFLLGSEDVRNAGQSMRSAAEQMSSAAGTVYAATDRLHNILDEHVTRIENALALPVTAEVSNVLTLRDQFAMAALTGMFASEPLREWQDPGFNGWAAQCAYICADAMLRARESQPLPVIEPGEEERNA